MQNLDSRLRGNDGLEAAGQPGPDMEKADPITIRQLEQDDAQQYRQLRLASLRDFQFAHGPDYEESLAKTLSWHEKRLAKPDYHWFGAFDGDTLVGGICLRTQEGRRLRHSASLNSLMVARSH